MGDIADWMIDQAIDSGEFFYRRMRRRRNGQGDTSHVQGRKGTHYTSALVTCRHCGAPRLRWKEVKGGWRLFNREGELHACKSTASPDEFEVIRG